MPGMDGLSALPHIREASPESEVDELMAGDNPSRGPDQRQQQRYGVIGHFTDAVVRHVIDGDAFFLRGRQIDIVDAETEAADARKAASDSRPRARVRARRPPR